MWSEWHVLPTDAKNIFPISYIFLAVWIKYSSRGPQKLSEWEFGKNRRNNRYVLRIGVIQNVSSSTLFFRFAEKSV